MQHGPTLTISVAPLHFVSKGEWAVVVVVKGESTQAEDPISEITPHCATSSCRAFELALLRPATMLVSHALVSVLLYI